MTAPTEPAPADTERTERLPWPAAMIRSTHFTPVGPRKKYYDPAEVEPFITRMVEEAKRWEQERDLLVTEARALREAKAARDDPRRATGPSVMAVDAMVRATTQAEQNLAAAQAEYREMRKRTRLMWEQAEGALAHANEATAVPTEPELPDPPTATDDPMASLEARKAHLQECRALLDGWERSMRDYVEERMTRLTESRGALDEQRGEYFDLLDRIEVAVPDLRSGLTDEDDSPAASAPDDDVPAEVA